MVFIIQAFENQSPEGRLSDVTTIELWDTNYDSALERTKKIISKPFYRLLSVIEKEK